MPGILIEELKKKIAAEKLETGEVNIARITCWNLNVGSAFQFFEPEQIGWSRTIS